MEKKKDLILIISTVLYLCALLLFFFAKYIDEEMGTELDPIYTAFVFGLTAYWLTKWSENDFKYNTDSIPWPIRAIAFIIAAVAFVQVNRYICIMRLGHDVLPIFMYAFILQCITLVVVGFAAAYLSTGLFVGGDGTKVWPVIIGSLACFGAAFALNYIFYADIGDLTAEMMPTKRCSVSRNCYSVGSEQWGGYGALIVMPVNLAQGIFIIAGIGSLCVYGCDKVTRSSAPTENKQE